MSSGLHRVLHSGHQDERLVGPALPWYNKSIEKTGRYTTQWKRVDFDTAPAFGSRASCTIPVAGALLSRVYVVSDLPSFGPGLTAAAAQAQTAGQTFLGPRLGYTNSAGHALLRQASITIGNTVYDTLDSRLLETLDEFGTPLEKIPLVNDLIARKDNGFYPGTYGGIGQTGPTTVAVPLPFWCFRGDRRSFLPLDALNASRVQIVVDFRGLAEMIVSDDVIGTETGDLIREAEIATETISQLTAGTGCADPSKINTAELNFYMQDISASTYAVINGIDFGNLRLGTTYLMVEYVYLDKLETYAWRNGQMQYPIVQHRAIPTVITNGSRLVNIQLEFNNPTRNIYLSVQRADAQAYNMHFQATRDLRRYDISGAGLWWPDASGLFYDRPGFLAPAYSDLQSEPLTSLSLTYEGKYVKTATTNPALYRSLLASLEQTKSPWVNRYYYCIPFGLGPGSDGDESVGESNWNRIAKKTLSLEFEPDSTGQVPNYNVYVHIESCNVLNIYGGTASLLFDY